MMEEHASPTGASTARTVNLSLVSHTNAGKTTLVRTLLARDVGEVRDAAHVTDVATGYPMLQAGEDALMLWDTPGFGDTARLLTRLRLSGNPIGWFLTQVWDRWRDRPMWSSQQAVRNARDHADVILYLVNASEDPEDAGYVALEMEILGWVGKPVVLLMNQTGPPRQDAHVEEDRWRSYLRDASVVQGSLTLDAFARCWVQERTLLATVGPLLDGDKQDALARLEGEWRRKNLERFHASMRVLAAQIARAVRDREPVAQPRSSNPLAAPLRRLANQDNPEAAKAMAKLAERLETDIRDSVEQLIRLHSLSGRATKEVLRRLSDDFSSSAPAKEGMAAALGGLVSGAMGGLAADLAAGGLTLGGGMLVGGLLGALGAGTAARGYNLAQGEAGEKVRWSEEFVRGLVRSALLRYLAVAHFGRGRGDYSESEYPAYWNSAVSALLDREAGTIGALWKGGGAADLEQRAEELLTRCTTELLTDFYPEARDLLATPGPLIAPRAAP